MLLIWGSGGAGGYVTDDAFEHIVGGLVGGLSQSLPVDAVYLDLHGTMCSETFQDAEGEVLRRVRATIGFFQMAVTSSLSNNFPRRPIAADMISEARIVKTKKRLAFGEVDLSRAVEGARIALVTLTYVISNALTGCYYAVF